MNNAGYAGPTRSCVCALAALIALTALARAETQTASPARAPVVHHTPPAEAYEGEELRLFAVIDDAWAERDIVARYRPAGHATEPYAEALFERSSAGGYYAVLPGDAVGAQGVEYYIAGRPRAGGSEVAHFASQRWPHVVRVEPPRSQRWEEAELRRLDGKRRRIAATVYARSFGTYNGAQDYFVRGEIEWTHRLVKRLYSFSLGYGFVEGVTPSKYDLMPTELDRGARYGYGGIRLRIASSVWADARAVMGFANEGFIAGGGGALMFGKEHRSHVQLGAEYIEEIGPTAWIKLQWDTVYPFMMAATAAVTDQPGANLDSGSWIAYDISYPLTSQLTLTGSLSFSARGNRPGGFGGGLSTAFEF